jgi:hypothetical protein
MRAYQFVSEAKGIFGRKIGDVYINDNGQRATFKQALIYPDDDIAYADHQTALTAVQRVQRGIGKEITWVNRETPQSNAFGIAFLNGEDGEIILWGRWYKSVPVNLITSWKNDEIPAGWVRSGKTAEKAVSGMTPQDLIKTADQFSDVDKLLDVIENNGASPEIMDGLRMVASGAKTAIFKNMAEKLTSVRDHLGEIITPIALISGVIKDTNSDNAAKEILKTEYKNCSFYFPQEKNNNLSDSEFVAPSGGKLKISTKGNKGATASIKNIYDIMFDKNNAKLVETYQDQVDIVTNIVKSGQRFAPLNLGIQLGIIDESLKDEILRQIASKVNRPETMSDDAKRLFIAYGSKESSPGYNIGYVLLANCAKKVAETLNKDPEFNKALLAFLQQGSVIQIYTDAKSVGNDVHITGFRTVYPPQFSGKVQITASKTYLSTGIKGNFTFDIGKGAS